MKSLLTDESRQKEESKIQLNLSLIILNKIINFFNFGTFKGNNSFDKEFFRRKNYPTRFRNSLINLFIIISNRKTDILQHINLIFTFDLNN